MRDRVPIHDDNVLCCRTNALKLPRGEVITISTGTGIQLYFLANDAAAGRIHTLNEFPCTHFPSLALLIAWESGF